MSQHYATPTGRARDQYHLPEIEVFETDYYECEDCGRVALDWTEAIDPCDCGGRWLHSQEDRKELGIRVGWKYFAWFCRPGCLPDSDPYGPYSTHAEALKEIREYGGCNDPI